MIKVSIIVPVYNKEKYLLECLHSIMNQSLKELEIICINDGSTDHSPAVLKYFASIDCRIQIISQKNLGAGMARNRGIDRSVGEFLMFMDADDYYPSSDIVEALYTTAKRKHAKICGGSFSECHADGSVRTQWGGMLSDYTFKSDRFMDFEEYQFDYGFHRYIFDAELVKLNQIYFPDLAWYEDPPFLGQAMLKAGQFYAIRKITYCYRFEYQKRKWNAKRVNDLVRGISVNMQAACENRLSKLLYLNYKRMTAEYFDTIKGCMTKENIELILLLIRADRIIHRSMLAQEMAKRVKDHKQPARRITRDDVYIQKMPLYVFFIKNGTKDAAAFSFRNLRCIAGRLYHAVFCRVVQTGRVYQRLRAVIPANQKIFKIQWRLLANLKFYEKNRKSNCDEKPDGRKCDVYFAGTQAEYPSDY